MKIAFTNTLKNYNNFKAFYFLPVVSISKVKTEENHHYENNDKISFHIGWFIWVIMIYQK